MPTIELAIRYRCATCGDAYEDFTKITIPTLPHTVESAVKFSLPPGFVLGHDGNVYCDRHQPSALTLVRDIPKHLLRPQ